MGKGRLFKMKEQKVIQKSGSLVGLWAQQPVGVWKNGWLALAAG